MGNADRIIRLVIAAIVIGLYFSNVLSGPLGIGLVLISAIFVVTSFVSFCPLYRLVGISTCPIKK